MLLLAVALIEWGDNNNKMPVATTDNNRIGTYESSRRRNTGAKHMKRKRDGEKEGKNAEGSDRRFDATTDDDECVASFVQK